MRCKVPLFVLLLLYIASPLVAENWPMWRGPNQNGVSSETKVPTSWTTTSGVQWKTALPGHGTSCPIVWNDQVFVTATSGRTHSELHLLCFDRRTGAKRWERRMTGYETPLFTQFPPLRGHAMPSPVTDGNYVVTLFATGELAAFDLNGRPLWFRSLQEDYGEIDNDYGLASSPVIVNDRIIVQIDHGRGSFLMACDLESGRVAWKVSREGIKENWTTPVLDSQDGNAALICAGTGLLEAHDAATGQKLWSQDKLARLCCPMPILTGRRLIVTSGPGGNVQGLTLAESTHQPPIVNWVTPKGAGFVPSAICVGDLYFYASDRGILSCLDITTGQEVWSRRAEGAFRGSPVAAAGNVYFTNLDGKTTIIAAERAYREVGGGELGEPISASPAISQGQLIFRTEKHLVCVGS